MKTRLAILLLLAGALAFAQTSVSGAAGIIQTLPPGGAGGSCTSTAVYVSAGTIYTCVSSLWTAVGGAGASGTPPYLVIGSNSYGPLVLLTPPTGSFSWINQNSSTVTTVNNAFTFSITATGGTDHLTCYMASIPGTAGADYTATAAILSSQFHAGVGLRESGSGKIIVVYADTGLGLTFQKWTSATAFSANYLSNTSLTWPAPLMWVRFQQSGTTRTTQMSADGVNWNAPAGQYSQTKDDFMTENQFGVCQETNTAFAAVFQLVHFSMTNP
jgi:hypothetical protein